MSLERKTGTEPVILPSSAKPTVAGAAGNYRVIRLLGRGTMASVYLAEQVSMARPVALKILSPLLANDVEFIERFMREARASARLNHPNIVAAIDFGEFDMRFFLAMEFVDGQPLSAMLDTDGQLDERRVLAIGGQVISALKHAHEHGVIHLDVKPANIMICKDGRVKLADFGLAVILDSPGSAEASRKAVGTPYYMSPEQVEGGKLDWRADQYSLGASLYEAVTGMKPFRGSSVSDILAKRFFENPEPAHRVGKRRASRYFSAILAKMLSRSPEGRYQSFGELATDFQRAGLGKKPLHAALSVVNRMSAPRAESWESLGSSRVIRRVDAVKHRLWWNWCIYSSLLFCALLGGYTALHYEALAGPVPPVLVRYDLVEEAENPPVDRRRVVTEAWRGALRLAAQGNVELARMSYRLLAGNPDFAGTAYAAAARRRMNE